MDTKPAPPSNYLALSIITTLLCCQVFGIIAIIYAAQVNSKYVAGDYAGAERSSRYARNWSFAGIGVGLLTVLILILIYGIGIFAALASGEFDV